MGCSPQRYSWGFLTIGLAYPDQVVRVSDQGAEYDISENKQAQQVRLVYPVDCIQESHGLPKKTRRNAIHGRVAEDSPWTGRIIGH